MDQLTSFDSCLSLKENLEAIFNAVYDGIVSLDTDMRVVNMNAAAEEFFGISREAAMGQSCFCEEMLGEVREVIEETLRKGTPVRGFSTTFRDRADEERTATISTALLHDNAGTVSGAIVIIHDISEIRRLQKRMERHPAYHKLIGRNRAMQEVYGLIQKVARSEASVLIEGESGVGKGVVAEAIHHLSARRDRRMVKVNCAALSETLLESELFGHVKGAFTGATADRVGRFEYAAGGTLFLDEIGEISPAIQVKLLTAIQDRTIERVGESRPRRVDVRIVAATNRPLREQVAHGLFREDLYYRLKVVRIEVPPLRDRIDDIPLLVEHFMGQERRRGGKGIEGIDAAALRALLRHRWPGNIRELEHAIAQAFVLAEGPTITVADLPEEIVRQEEPPPLPSLPPSAASGDRARIVEALARCGGVKGEAAALLGIDRTTLWRKMRRFDIAG